jgi:hypothetical protein
MTGDTFWLDEGTSLSAETERVLDLRDRLAAKLRTEGSLALADSLLDCGSEILLQCSECGVRKKGRAHCDRRWCPICARRLSAARCAKHERAVAALKWPLFVTLTVRNRATLARDTLVWLLRCFRRLRQTVWWKRCNVRGGFVSLEITNEGRGWHPHLHLIVDCEWLATETAPPPKWWSREKKAAVFKRAAAELEMQWARLVKQPTASVRTRRAFGSVGGKRVIQEIMKYAVKPSALVESHGSATEVIDAMKRTRLFRGFGSCHKLKLDDVPRDPVPCECGACKSYLPAKILDERDRRREEKRYCRTPSKEPRRRLICRVSTAQ